MTEFMTFQHFTWRGKPILDIHEWARERGEQMVKYDIWDYPPWSLEKVYSHTEECPESFFSSMRFNDDIRNVRRYNP